MKIKSIHILNFKNFEGSHQFSLNENINIFYAENGFGKSSFFDALEWCLTGEINRYKVYDGFNDEDIINYNVNEEVYECSVKIEFFNGSIERSLNVENLRKKGRTQVKVEYRDENGEIIKVYGKKYINKLIENKSCLSVDSLINIKQTHILSQDQITNFINSEKPKERYNAVLSIMGIENKVLIDNLKNVNRRLDKYIEELKCEEKQYDVSEKYLLNEKKNIDIELLVNNIRNLESIVNNSKFLIDSISKKKPIENYILEKKIKEKLKLDSIKYKEQKGLVDKIYTKEYKNIKSFQNDNKKCIEIMNDLDYKVKATNLEQEKNSKRIEKVKKEKNHFEHILKIKEDINKKYDELKQLKLNDKSVENYNYLNKELSRLKYAEKYKAILKQNNIDLKKYINKRVDLEKEVKEISRVKQEKKNKVYDIENKLSKVTAKELINLIDGLKKIKVSLGEKDNIEICPLCKSNIENIEFIKIIDQSIDEHEKKVSITEQITKKLLLDKDELVKKINLDDNKLSKLGIEMNRLNISIEKLEENISSIISHRLYDEKLINFNSDYIKLELKNITNKLENIIKYKKLNEEIEELKEPYKEELEIISGETNEFSAIVLNLNNTYNELNKKLFEMKAEKSKLNNIVNENNEILYRLDKNILNYDKDIEELKEELEKRIEEIEKRENDINYILYTLKDYKYNLQKDIEINKIKDYRQLINKKVTLISEKKESIALYISELNRYSKECIEIYLNNEESPVKKYYNYLNPMPIKQSLYFNTDEKDEKLSIEIKCNKNDITRLANKTLSSGQLNVLALSIFLAMNEYQKLNNLNMIAIDDPIQNMDDINQFSVCDILSNIKGQLIFSTHDIEFLKLFLKKNNFKSGNITVFNIQSPYVTPEKIKIIKN